MASFPMSDGIGSIEILAELKSRGVFLEKTGQFEQFRNIKDVPPWLWEAFIEQKMEVIQLLRTRDDGKM